MSEDTFINFNTGIVTGAAQGTDAWKRERLGKATASRVADIVARTKTGWGASRANYAAEIVVERLTGEPQDSYQSAAMQYGVETEPQARAAYAFMRNVEVVEVGFVPHPTIAMSGASPDGLIGKDGLVELKCPNSSTMIDILLTEAAAIDARYIKQVQYQLAVTQRRWCDLVFFDRRLPSEMSMRIFHLVRNDQMIADLEKEVVIFLLEVDAKVAALTEKYLKAIA